jgi:hypothetical protein
VRSQGNKEPSPRARKNADLRDRSALRSLPPRRGFSGAAKQV